MIDVIIKLFKISPFWVETLLVNDFIAYDSGTNPLSNLTLLLPFDSD